MADPIRVYEAQREAERIKRGIDEVIRKMKRSPGSAGLSDAVLIVAKQMGIDPEDIVRYGAGEPSSDSEIEPIEAVRQGLDDPVSRVAEAFGNSPEDLKRFGV